MGFSLGSIFERIHRLRVPTVGSPLKVYFLGVLNFVIFGWGTIISGFVDGCTEDILIGLLQFLIPVIGWIWSVVWGFLMLSRKFKQTRVENDSISSPISQV